MAAEARFSCKGFLLTKKQFASVQDAWLAMPEYMKMAMQNDRANCVFKYHYIAGGLTYVHLPTCHSYTIQDISQCS